MKETSSKEAKNLLKESVEYFQEYSIFRRLFQGFREKYLSYGRFSGIVVLQIKTEEDIEVLEGFFQSNFHGHKTVSISSKRFEKALSNTRFAAIEPQILLEKYFLQELISRKEQKQRIKEQWDQIFLEILEENDEKPANSWLLDMKEGTSQGIAMIAKRYRDSNYDGEMLRQELRFAAQILNHLPFREANCEYLAIFAATQTGNPHSFDEGSEGGKLLNDLIMWEAKKQGIWEEEIEIFPILRKQKVYLKMGIFLDDISNYAIMSGVYAWKTKKEHRGMAGFVQEGDSVLVPVSVIYDWKRIECPEGEIYIVENPSIYAMLARKWKGKRACMCMNGQPRLSAILILDLLAKANVHVYYGGDFDPEGLLIAQKLRRYYKGEFSYWHMSVDDYQKSKPAVLIREKRIKILERIIDSKLLETAQAIAQESLAGYQENIWNEYE